MNKLEISPKIGNILEILTGIYLVIISSYPFVVWYMFIIGLIPILSSIINLYNKTLGKRIKIGIEIVILSIIISYIYLITDLLSHSNQLTTSTPTIILSIGLIITLITFITKLFE